jgi:hypothetical protein
MTIEPLKQSVIALVNNTNITVEDKIRLLRKWEARCVAMSMMVLSSSQASDQLLILIDFIASQRESL